MGTPAPARNNFLDAASTKCIVAEEPTTSAVNLDRTEASYRPLAASGVWKRPLKRYL